MELDPKFEVETSSKPWFGPRKRARALLVQRSTVLDPHRAAQALVELLGPHAHAIQRVRFIDFWHEDEDFRYTIALVWTWSDAATRQAIYEAAETMVRHTGWYLLPQGERIGSRLAQQRDLLRLSTSGALALDLKGPLRAICSAVESDGGCSVRLRCARGSMLLDAGLPGHLRLEGTERTVLLSHSHTDHFGGIEEGQTRDLPVVMSLGTARVLLAQGCLPSVDSARKSLFVTPGADWTSLGHDIEIKAFLVPHAPGSIGYVVRDATTAVVYTGDVVARTRRHDFIPHLSSLVHSLEGRERYLLIDATMAGRRAGASEADAASQFFERTKHLGDVAVVSRDSEQLMYSYLDLFHYAKKTPELRFSTHFLITSKLKPLFRLLHASYIAREMHLLDPLLEAQYGRTMSAWAESRFLYWLHRRTVPPENRSDALRIWFITQGEMDGCMNLPAMHVALVGALPTTPAQWEAGASIIGTDTSPWTLHSDEDTLLALIRQLQSSARLILFHNFPKRLRRFVQENQVTCDVLTSREILLGVGAAQQVAAVDRAIEHPLEV